MNSTMVIQRNSLTDIAYEEIKKSICLGKFKPGHKLVVDDLIKTYVISNTPIKEALNRLVAEGLVESVPRRGMQVKKITAKEIREIYDIRLMHETYCAKKAIEVIENRDDIKIKLSNIIKEFEKLIDNQSSYDYIGNSRLDEEFHLTILSLSGNETLVKEYKKYKAINMAFKNYSYRDLPLKRCKKALEEHKAIYEALISKDTQMLIDSIENHILNVMKDALEFISDRE